MRTEIITKNDCIGIGTSTIDTPYGVKLFNDCDTPLTFKFSDIIQTNAQYDQVKIEWSTIRFLNRQLNIGDIVSKDEVFTITPERKANKFYTIYFNLMSNNKTLGLGLIVIYVKQCLNTLPIT